jgi:hypothetical protein
MKASPRAATRGDFYAFQGFADPVVSHAWFAPQGKAQSPEISAML